MLRNMFEISCLFGNIKKETLYTRGPKDAKNVEISNTYFFQLDFGIFPPRIFFHTIKRMYLP